MNYYVYILANKLNAVIYTGVTKDLIRRVYEHRHHLDPDSFTARYDVTRLVFTKPLPMYAPQLSVKSKLKVGTGREKTAWLRV